MTISAGGFGAYALPVAEAKILSLAQSLPANWLGRRLALVLRKLVLRGRGITVDATVEGLKLRLHTGDNVSERKFLFMPQFFDAYERNLMRARLSEASTFVDIGANAGIYSLTAAVLVGDSGRVLAIEPNPKVLARLQFNAALNGFDGRIVYAPYAVAEKEGSFDLTLDDSNLGGSSLVIDRGGARITVTCRPLLDIVNESGLSRIDMLKADIEGAEDQALIPFLDLAPPHLYPRVIILENAKDGWQRDLPGALRKAGYLLLKTTRMNQVWEKA